ncbi:glycosyltransferase family 2 protein [Mariniflexile gromovii]|uniref:Glycosyltransferase family 2 protein n=1 Tax=Mariniflexile gromovii TaxID=362523 RepID=A0ABS4BQJ1_9FLAO|nr:glycosyltransferase family 2 protein [Mariniflexile gromovii]MBP0902850.1 glycosyltransferase family 2 protein [Mariniflexile gromovii]
MKPLVSIITPMFNSEAFISETINSVINQTYKNWELLLIDDGSTDKTLQIVAPFISQDANIKLLKNQMNAGAAISRNKGIEASNGKYIAFLDGDDVWKPQKLQVQIEFMETHNCDVSFSSYEQIGETGKPLNKFIKALPELTYQKYLRSNYIGNLTGMFNAEILGKITAPNLRKRQDWALWLSAIKKSGKPAKGIQESLAYYRVRKDSMSSNKINLLKHNYLVYRKGLGFSTVRSMFYMLVFLYEHFFVKSKQVVSTNTI